MDSSQTIGIPQDILIPSSTTAPEKLNSSSEYLDYLNNHLSSIQDLYTKKQYFKEILNIYKNSKTQASLKALPSLAQMLSFDDEGIIIEAIHALSSILRKNEKSINKMIYNGTLMELLKLCENKSSEKIIEAALSFLIEIIEFSEQARFLLYFARSKETLAKLIIADNQLMSARAIDIIYKVYYPNEDNIRKLFSYEKLSISKDKSELKSWINKYSIAIILSKIIENLSNEEIEKIIELKVIDSLLESLGEHSIIIINTSLMCLSHMITAVNIKDGAENPFLEACKNSEFFIYLEKLNEKNSFAKSLYEKCLKNKEEMSSIYMEDLEMIRKAEKMALKEGRLSLDGGEEEEFIVDKEFNLIFNSEEISEKCSDTEEYEFETSLHNNFIKADNKKAYLNASNSEINTKDEENCVCRKETQTVKPISICIESPNSTIKFEENGEASNSTTKNIALTSNNHKFDIALSSLIDSPSISIKISDSNQKSFENVETMTEKIAFSNENQPVSIEIEPSKKDELTIDEALFYIEVKPSPKDELLLEKSLVSINIKPYLKKDKCSIEKSQSLVTIQPNLKQDKLSIEKSQSLVTIQPNLKKDKCSIEKSQSLVTIQPNPKIQNFLIQKQASSINIKPIKSQVTQIIPTKKALEASPITSKEPKKVKEEVKTPKTNTSSISSFSSSSRDYSPETPSYSPAVIKLSKNYSPAPTTPSYSYTQPSYERSSISRSSTYSDYSDTSSSYSWSSTFTGSPTRAWNGNFDGPKKKDGTPDMRYKANYR